MVEWRANYRPREHAPAAAPRSTSPRAFAVHPGVEQSVGQLRCYCYRPGYYRLSRGSHGATVRAAAAQEFSQRKCCSTARLLAHRFEYFAPPESVQLSSNILTPCKHEYNLKSHTHCPACFNVKPPNG